MTISLNTLQKQLERTYEVAVPHDVNDFLVSAPLAEAAGQDVEQLLIFEGPDDTLDIGLFIEHSVVAGLESDDPTQHLHAGNLKNFCVALEGVSHFLYLTWHASHHRAVSLLELELQAEIDKFVAAAFLFAHQRNGRIPNDLSARMFENVTFDERLDDVTRDRYRCANHYAHKYCEWLTCTFLREPGDGLMRELRRFYRRTQNAKIELIESARRIIGP